MRTILGAVLLIGLVAAGCGGLQEMWSGPDADRFHPKSIAVLPPIVGVYEGAREEAHAVVTAALKASKRYEQVVPVEQVNSLIQSSKESSDGLAAYYSRLEASGASDREIAAKLGEGLAADALLVVKVGAWEYTREDGKKLAKVGLGFRLIDTKTGGIVWKGRHEEKESYTLFKPKLQTVAAGLSEYLVGYMPK